MAAQATILKLQSLKAAMTLSATRTISLTTLEEQVRSTKYSLAQGIVDDIHKAVNDHGDRWELPVEFTKELFQAAQNEHEVIDSDWEDGRKRRMIKQSPRVAEVCRGINMKERNLEWPMLKRAIKEDGYTLDQFSPQAAQLCNEWAIQFDTWRPSNRQIEKLLFDAVEEVREHV